MKSIITSVSPYLCEKIVSGDCKILVKKSAPKEVPFKCYIYCTKMRKKADLITKSEKFGWIMCSARALFNRAEEYDANGKVIGEFICDRIEMVNAKCNNYGIDLFYHDCLTKGCLTEREIEEYFNIPEDKDLRVMKGNGYVWYISDLKIYDKPKELGEFIKRCNCKGHCFMCEREVVKQDKSKQMCVCYEKATRPPQPWMFVEEIETR